MNSPTDLTGKRFGRLLVLRRVEGTRSGGGRWLCVCDCGNQRIVYGSHLRSGATKSCGCWSREVASRVHKGVATYGNLRHGGKGTRLYGIWSNMKTRCLNKNNRAYKWYGAVGVTICDKWMRYEGFRDWALCSGYADDLTIDRINPFDNYEPSNCRWVPLSEQRGNQRRSYRAS